ncbi:MAG: hypothetical protein ACXW3S_02220 [Rhodoplanes sp.]
MVRGREHTRVEHLPFRKNSANAAAGGVPGDGDAACARADDGDIEIGHVALDPLAPANMPHGFRRPSRRD